MREDAYDLLVQLSLRSVDEINALLGCRPLDWLSQQEEDRWTQLKTSARKKQFLAGHWLARHAAASWLGGDWSDYVLSAPEDAAPCLLGGPQTLAWREVFVSLSHSGDWVACALARHPIGVDVECSSRIRDFPALGRWICRPPALQEFERISPELQKNEFYTRWTLKEAWLKHAGSSPDHQSMQSIHFHPGSANKQAIVAQTERLTLALYPARAVQTRFIDLGLQTMDWFDWAYRPSH